MGVSVLKVGVSPAGALAAAAHTGAVAGDHRVFRALVEEAGVAWAEDVHELLELAKAQAVPAARPRSPVRGGLAVLTCSGGDSALAADYCARNGLDLPPLGAGHRHAAPRAPAGRRHGGQPARLHRPDLGRGGHPAGHRGRGGRGPGDRSGGGVLRPARRHRRRARAELGRRARGHPRRRRRVPRAGDGGLNPPRAARRHRGRALRGRRHTRHRRAPHRPGLRGGAAHGAGRPGAPARDRRRGGARLEWHRRRRCPSTRPRTC